MEYPDVFAIIEQKVRPERQRTNPDGTYVLRKPLPQRWWQYADKRPALREAIANLDRVLVIARVSKTALPLLVPAGQVMSEQIVVFATNQPAFLALLSSSLHFTWWTIKGESSLRADPRYTPSDGFETFPQPTQTERLGQLGHDLEVFRESIMQRRQVGLTGLYTNMNKDTESDPEINGLREIHVEIDEGVREAYALDEDREPYMREFEARIASAPLPAWRDIELGHGFHETRQGVRFTISPQARIDVLDKLLALNHYRYRQEQERGLHNKKSVRKKRPATPPNATSPELDDGTLLPPPDALF